MPGSGGSGFPLGPRGRWCTYTPADGLAALHVEDIVEDHEGCLWFGTRSGGVSRYDGESFRTFSVAEGLTGEHSALTGAHRQESRQSARGVRANGPLSGPAGCIAADWVAAAGSTQRPASSGAIYGR